MRPCSCNVELEKHLSLIQGLFGYSIVECGLAYTLEALYEGSSM
jgi:hypothetical protein